MSDTSEPVDLTYGQRAVGVSFNPSADPEVGLCKQMFADAIDQMHALRMRTESNEVARMCAIAITEAQTAQMWAVKAITWRS